MNRLTGPIWCLSVFLLQSLSVKPQKPSLHPFKNDAWIKTTIGGAKLSNNGGYFAYAITSYANTNRSVCFVRSATGSWKIQLDDIKTDQVEFDPENKFVMYKRSSDSLYIVGLGTTSSVIIPLVTSFRVPKRGRGRIAYYIGAQQKLVIRDLRTGRENIYNNIKDYQFSEDGNSIVLTEIAQDSLLRLWLVNFKKNDRQQIWAGKNYYQFIMDTTATHLAILSYDKPGDPYSNAIWYYEKGMEVAKVILCSANAVIPGNFSIENEPLQFGVDRRQIFLRLNRPFPPPVKKNDMMVALDVWNYQDSVLWPDMRGPDFRSVAVVHANTGRMVELTGGYKKIINPETMHTGVVLIREQAGNEYERYWNPVAREITRLVSSEDGRVIKDFTAEGACSDFNLSPLGRYVVYFKSSAGHYFSYDVKTGVTRNITARIPVSFVTKETATPAEPPISNGCVWLKGERAFYIYDSYDIWNVDPAGTKESVNITKGYGRQHNIRFRFQRIGPGENDFFPNEPVIVKAFYQRTKNRGYFQLQPGGRALPELLSAGPYGEERHSVHSVNGAGSIYIRTTVSMAPNYFYTRDHKIFEQLTNIEPHTAYNWMRSELINWTMYDGQPGEAILYKPEDFDPAKKYPVIFYYYENSLPDYLHTYIKPEPTVMLDYPYFVSNGYLVCIPSIQKTLAVPGPSAYNAVGSAADYLAKISWVDSTKMGLSGHSYGSYETNYIITATNRFSAAYSGCGYSNLVGLYGQSSIGLMWCEYGQTSIGSSLSENPEAYIKNSPVFKTANIRTPLLLLNNRKDETNFRHGVEMFIALRRQRKPVWLLQYDEGDHTMERREAEDFSMRLSQFFDHYLKGKPAPVWMTRGIARFNKQVDDGLAIDSSEIQSYNSLNK